MDKILLTIEEQNEGSRRYFVELKTNISATTEEHLTWLGVYDSGIFSSTGNKQT